MCAATQNQRVRAAVWDESIRSKLECVTATNHRTNQNKLQTFDSNILIDWLSVRNLYTSLIYVKADLPDVATFHCSKGYLAGKAKALVNPLVITRTIYQVAWNILTKRVAEPVTGSVVVQSSEVVYAVGYKVAIPTELIETDCPDVRSASSTWRLQGPATFGNRMRSLEPSDEMKVGGIVVEQGAGHNK